MTENNLGNENLAGDSIAAQESAEVVTSEPALASAGDPAGKENPSRSFPSPAGGGYLTILQLILSLTAMLSLWGLAFLLLLLGLLSLSALQGSSGSINLGFLLQSAGLATCGVLLIPSIITSILRIRNKPLKDDFQPLLNLNPFIPVLLLLPVLGLGYLVVDTSFAGVILPFFHALGVILPVLFLVILCVRQLDTGSPQRRSGVFAAGLTLGPFVILVLEALALVGMIVVVSILIANQPELASRMMQLTEELPYLQGNPEDLFRLLTPFLSSPEVILAVVTFIAIIVPLIEELFKPIGVWFLVGRGISPAEGFAAGAISGAGFAIFESLMLNTGVNDWLVGSVLRIGTAVIHIMTTAMSGWALAYAWRDGRYLRLVLTYLGVVFIHGLWNGVTILSVIYELGVSEGGSSGLGGINYPYLETISILAPFILGALTIGGFTLLILMNRNLRHQKVAENLPEPAA